jgi:transcriptional regulator with XRE-family HTH domain
VNDENGTGSTTARAVTVNQVVAWNMAWYRRAAGLTQRQLGDQIGWTNTAVSAAERSWDGRITREFSAQALADLSLALRVPVTGLLLPPEGTGAGDLVVAGPQGEYGMGDLLARVVMPDSGDGSPSMTAYRGRLCDAVERHLDPQWAGEVVRWLRETESDEMLDDHAKRLRARQAEAARAAGELGSLASAIENRGRLA